LNNQQGNTAFRYTKNKFIGKFLKQYNLLPHIPVKIKYVLRGDQKIKTNADILLDLHLLCILKSKFPNFYQ